MAQAKVKNVGHICLLGHIMSLPPICSSVIHHDPQHVTTKGTIFRGKMMNFSNVEKIPTTLNKDRQQNLKKGT